MVEKKNRRSKMRAPGPEKEIQGAKRGASFRSLEKAVEPKTDVDTGEDIHWDPGSPEGDRSVTLSVIAQANMPALDRLRDILDSRRVRAPEAALMRGLIFPDIPAGRTRVAIQGTSRIASAAAAAFRNLEEAAMYGDPEVVPETPSQRQQNWRVIDDFLQAQQHNVSEFSMQMPTIAYTSDDYMRTRLPSRANPTFSAQPVGGRRNAAAHVAMAIGAQLLVSSSNSITRIIDALDGERMRAQEMHLIFSNSETYFFIWEGTRGIVFDGEGTVVRRGLTADRGQRLVQKCFAALTYVVRV